jgi:hypothetical protein
MRDSSPLFCKESVGSRVQLLAYQYASDNLWKIEYFLLVLRM